MKELEGKISKLTEAEDKESVRILQGIGKMLLTQYVIRIQDDFIIEPLRVEAYYYHPGRFQDKNIHHRKDKDGQIQYGTEDQKDNFGGLYIHRGFGGVDVCLSNSKDFALSFLIKNSRIINSCSEIVQPFCKQIALGEMFSGKCEEYRGKCVLCRREEKDRGIVFYTVRKGLTQGTYKNEFLAALKEINGKDHDFDWEKGFGKEKIVAEHMKSNPQDNTLQNWKAFLGWIPKQVRESLK